MLHILPRPSLEPEKGTAGPGAADLGLSSQPVETEVRNVALNLYGGRDPKELPAYPIAEVAQFLRLPQEHAA